MVYQLYIKSPQHAVGAYCKIFKYFFNLYCGIGTKNSQKLRISYTVPNMEEIRKLEADLKRKSELLTEVKILLKQAADRERAILNSKEELSHKLKVLYISLILLYFTKK